jgi:hypothetical protein
MWPCHVTAYSRTEHLIMIPPAYLDLVGLVLSLGWHITSQSQTKILRCCSYLALPELCLLKRLQSQTLIARTNIFWGLVLSNYSLVGLFVYNGHMTSV